MGSKEADHSLQDILFINLITLGLVSDVKKITQLKFLRDRCAKTESIHVWYLIIEPINVQANHIWEGSSNEVCQLHIFVFTVLCDNADIV